MWWSEHCLPSEQVGKVDRLALQHRAGEGVGALFPRDPESHRSSVSGSPLQAAWFWASMPRESA